MRGGAANLPSPLGEGGRRSRPDEGESQRLWFSLIRHAPHDTFPQGGRKGALALAALLLSSAPALACSCIAIAPEGWRSQASAIVQGRVVGVKQERSVNGRVIARIFVTRAVKGATPRLVTVTTRGTSAACGYGFRRGQSGEFLLARDSGRYSTNLCLMMGARR